MPQFVGRGIPPDLRGTIADLIEKKLLLDVLFRIGINMDTVTIGFQLTNAGKQIMNVVDGPVPQRFHYLPGAGRKLIGQ